MKNLKFLILSLFAISIGFTSCDKSDVSPSTDESAYVDFMFLATTADSSKTTHNGKKCNLTEVAVASLPAAITSYVSTNYAGATIDRAGTTTEGNYVLHVVKADGTHAGLIFDSKGAFVEVRQGKGGKGTEVALADLPAAITSYISTNYAGSTTVKAMTNADGKFGVLITKADATKLMLGFNADGSFVGELSMDKKGGKGKGGKRN
jgi:hypothetical protein